MFDEYPHSFKRVTWEHHCNDSAGGSRLARAFMNHVVISGLEQKHTLPCMAGYRTPAYRNDSEALKS